MSWFQYGTPLRRLLRKGVWLRVRSLPKPLADKAKKYLKAGERIEWVVIKEIRPNKQVLLEFWCTRLQIIKPGNPVIYKVFHLLVDEDPEWVCEGDLGRGYKGE